MRSSLPQLLVLVLATGAIGTGCAQRPPVQPSLRVVEASVQAQGPLGDPSSPGETARLIRVGDRLGLRLQPVWEVTPRARHLLATASETLPAPTHHPQLLPQEEREELARLRTLVAENEKAMRRLDEASATLAEAAQALLRRTEKLGESSPPPKKPVETAP